MENGMYIETPADAVTLFRAALPKEQKEERVFVLPLDANGKVLAKPILVSVGSEDGTTAIDPGTIFREAFKAGAEEIIVRSVKRIFYFFQNQFFHFNFLFQKAPG